MIVILIALLLIPLIIAYFNNNDSKQQNEPKPLSKEYAKKYFTQQHQSTYDNLLQDERWQNKRNEILQRDKHKCSYCGSDINLQVHHKYYNKYPDGKKVTPWDYPNDALITLCNDCHKEVHKNKKIKTYYRSRKIKYN